MGESSVDHAGYETSLYGAEFLSQVVNLHSDFFGGDYNDNLAYFNWKYGENPYTEYPLGIVALYKGKVVGFRGYFATKWQIRDKTDEIIVLSPSDTCVHSDHRMKGLSMAMGEMAMDEYAKKYKVLFNSSTNNKSLPGYLKMGFLPLMNKAYITRYSLLGLSKFILLANKTVSLQEKGIEYSKFDNIEISNIYGQKTCIRLF